MLKYKVLTINGIKNDNHIFMPDIFSGVLKENGLIKETTKISKY